MTDSRPERVAMVSTRNETARAPTKAAAVTTRGEKAPARATQAPGPKPPRKAIARDAPKTEPAVTPTTAGEARPLRKSPCKYAPARARDAPAPEAVSARHSRHSYTVCPVPPRGSPSPKAAAKPCTEASKESDAPLP